MNLREGSNQHHVFRRVPRQPADYGIVLTLMNTAIESVPNRSHPSAASRAMIERLIGFNTVSRDSNLGLIEWVRDYLQGFGAVTRLTHDATGKKANLFATLGDSQKARPDSFGPHATWCRWTVRTGIRIPSSPSSATANCLRAARRT